MVERHAGWTGIWVVASCLYPELPGLPDATGDGPPPMPYASCVGLPSTCGPDRTESCCASAMTIPGGTFFRGYDTAPDAHNNMGYPATVSTFVLDKYEVTVGRFRTFVEAEMGTQANPPAAGAGGRRLNGEPDQGGWDDAWNTNLVLHSKALKDEIGINCNVTFRTWTDSREGNEHKPINCVTWYEAMAFCIWDGGYLPTEAESHYAASGGDEQRAYPWSSPASSTDIDCSYANYFVDSPVGGHCVNGVVGAANDVGSESTKGDGRWGHSDLSGNVHEWALDSFGADYPDPQSCHDCATLSRALPSRVIRGGGFLDRAGPLRAGARFAEEPDFRGYGIGWRCARTP